MSYNIILDTLPETVTVDGRDFFVDTDFRTFIIFEKMLNSPELSNKDKVLGIIDLFYTEGKPRNPKAAVDAILELYRCGMEDKPLPRRMNGNVELKSPQIYDFEYDAPYIYGAFLSQYGIDLNDIEYLHWWKFQAMFKSLEESCKIVEIMGYRATDLGAIKNQHERDRIARLQRIYALPDNRSTEDKVAMAGAAFGGAFM